MGRSGEVGFCSMSLLSDSYCWSICSSRFPADFKKNLSVASFTTSKLECCDDEVPIKTV